MQNIQKHQCVAKWLDDKHVVETQVFGDIEKHTKWTRGITKCIPQLSPEFSISVCLKGVKNGTIKSKNQGRKKGNDLDRELTLWTNERKKYTEPSEAFIKVKEMMEEKGLTPVRSQLPLGCHEINVGTRMDILCEDTKGGYVVLEIKRGYDDYFDVHNQGNFIKPLDDIPVSFRMKSFIQLLITCWLFEHTLHDLPEKPIHAAYVVHVFKNDKDKTIIDTIPLPFWMVGNTKIKRNILTAFNDTSSENREKRKIDKRNGASRARYKHRKKENDKND